MPLTPLQKNLDPEVAKEVNERQARYSNIQNAMTSGDLRGGYVLFCSIIYTIILKYERFFVAAFPLSWRLKRKPILLLLR